MKEKKYKTRTEFARQCHGAYSASKKLGIFESICSHMEKKVNNHKRGLYIIKFPRIKSCYVGLTYNPEERKKQHLKKSSNYKVKKLLKEKEKYVWECIENFYHIDIIKEKEQQCIDEMKSKGWDILNINKVGALGSKPSKWTPETLSKEAAKYSTKKLFREKNTGAYSTAFRLKILDNVCSHMKVLKKPIGYWTEEKIIEEAKNFDNRKDFGKNSVAAYRIARELKIIDEVCKHMKTLRIRWTKEKIIEQANKFDTRIKFKKGNSNAYATACRWNIMDEVCQHMKRPKIYNYYWTEERVQEVANKYQYRKDFKKESNKAYSAVVRLKVLPKICSHMKPKHSK